MKYLIKLLVFSSLLMACGKPTSDETVPTEMITIEVSGNKIDLPKDPKRVVVLDLGIADMIHSIGKLDQVVAIPEASYPEQLSYLKDIPNKVGSLKEPNIEAIANLDPDLIIVSARTADFESELSKISPTVNLSTDSADTWTSIQTNAQIIGELFDSQTKMAKNIEGLQAAIDSLNSKATQDTKKNLVLMQNGEKLSAFSTGSRFGVIYDAFGFRPLDDVIETSTHGQDISPEGVLMLNPDRLFIINRGQAVEGQTNSSQSGTEMELIKETSAGKNNEIHYLQADLWYLTGSGVESLNAMVKELEQIYQ